jgi:hypothetical protein
MRLLRKVRGAHLLGVVLGMIVGLAVLMVAGPKLSQWMGLTKPAPFVLH